MRPRVLACLVFLAVASTVAAQPPARSSADDDRANLHYRAGWELLASESWAESAREFRAALDINPDFKLAYYGLGRADMGLKRFGDAIHAYETCRGLYESQAGRNFSNKAEADRVIADDVLQIDMTVNRLSAGPQSPSVQAQIAQLRMQKQRLQSKTRGAESMSLMTPVPPFLSLALGSAYFRTGRLADAEREYRAATDGDSRYGEAWSNLAVVYLETARYDEAERAVKAAEKAGFHVNPGLKDEIRKRKSKG